MIYKNTINLILGKFRPHAKPRTYTKQTIYPRRDWLIGLCMSVVVLLLGSVYTFYTFARYSSLEQFVVGTSKPLTELKVHTIDKVITDFGKKREVFEENDGSVSNESPSEVTHTSSEGEVLEASIPSDASTTVVTPVTEESVNIGTSTGEIPVLE